MAVSRPKGNSQMTSSNGTNGNGTKGDGGNGSIPKPRAEWTAARRAEAARTGDTNLSQMHCAKQGVVTDEMKYVAWREKLDAELVRSEVARGRMIIPANVNHPNLEPMGIGIALSCKVNANIGNSAVTSEVEKELQKLEVC